MDIRDKVSKLLALSQSPNEHEAQSAMLKAKELMVAHKLTLVDFQKRPDAQVIRYKTDVRCSKAERPWTVDLAAAIANNYCCRSYMTHVKGEAGVHIALTGYEEDVMVCLTVLRYALQCIDTWIANIIELCSALYTAEDMESICDSYARGFIRGVEAAYRKQSAEHEEWGLVLVTPPEASMLIDTLRKVKFDKASPSPIPNLFNQGFRDGIGFEPAAKRADERERVAW